MSTPDSLDSDYLPLVVMDTTSSAEKCSVCGKPAFCYNYGVLSCNACKMFFRRVEVDRITYRCKYWSKCYDGLEFVDACDSTPRCRYCRYQRCLQVGMKYLPPGKPQVELVSRSNEEFTSTIKNLLLTNSKMRHKMYNFYTGEDPTLLEIVLRNKKSQLILRNDTQKVNLHEWSFLGIYAAVEHFLNYDFMESVSVEDKVALLRNYALKALVFAGGMRSLAGNSDRVMTPDGNDVYPEIFYKLRYFSNDFLNGIRSRLVSRLRDLKVTNEEYVILNVILFCNPAIHPLSPSTQKLITARQKIYSSALFQYCLLTYQQAGPCRFADLLSICTVINKQTEDIAYLTTLLQLNMPTMQYKKLFVDVCHK